MGRREILIYTIETATPGRVPSSGTEVVTEPGMLIFCAINTENPDSTKRKIRNVLFMALRSIKPIVADSTVSVKSVQLPDEFMNVLRI